MPLVLMTGKAVDIGEPEDLPELHLTRYAFEEEAVRVKVDTFIPGFLF